MAEVGNAFVSLLPSAKGFGSKMDSQIGPELDKAGRTGGGRLSAALGGVLKKSVFGIGVAAGGILGTALFKGFARLSAIDEAQAKLRGLGNSAKTVSQIMDNALASVKGTAFGLGDAATVAAGAVASGIKPGKALTKNLKLVADAATIAGVPLNEMGAIFNKVAASGKIQGDVIAQLGDKGIPILQLLGKEIGKTPAQVAKLASQGKIDFKTFSDAMQSGLGGAALKSGNTFKGALANMQAALGRLGAGLLKDLFPIAKRVFGNVTVLLDQVTAKIDPATKAVKDFFTSGAGHTPAVVAIGAIRDAAEKIGDGFQASIDKLDEFQSKVGTLDLNNLDGKKIGKALSTAVSTAITSIGNLSVKIVAAFGQMLQDVDWVGIGIKAGPAAIGLVLGLATGILNGVTDGHLWQNIWDHGFDVALAVLAVVLAPTKILGPIAKILGKIPFVGKFVETFLNWLIESRGKILGPIGTFFRDIFGNLFSKLFEGVSIPGAGLIAKILGTLRTIPAAVAEFFVGLGESFYLRMLQAGDKIAAGLRAAIPGTIRFVASIPGRILRAIGGLARLLFPRGSDVISGLLQGIRYHLPSVTGFVRAIPGKIKGAIGSLGGLLVNAGKALMNGFLGGIKAGWKKVTGFVGGMAGWIGKHKGPLEYDRKLLIPHGNAMMAGLNEGLTFGFGKVQSNVSSMGGQLSSSVALPAGSRLRAADSIAAASSLVGSEPMNEQSMERAFARALAGASFEMSQDNRYLKTKVRRG